MQPTIAQMKQALAKPKPTKASEALGQHEGKTLMVTQADRTKVGGKYLGGPGFSGIGLERPEYAGKVWGVGQPATASTILGANRRVPKGEAVWSTLIGTPEQHTSNQMVFNTLVEDFKKAAKMGMLTPDLHAKINARLSAVADKEGNPYFGTGADIRDPALIKSADTFAKRKIIADLIGGHGAGGKKGQIGNYDKLVRATTDPMLLDVPTHSIGPRLFSLSGETSERPDLHPAFPTLLHGEDFGQTYHPVPKELMLRDYVAKMQKEKGRSPGYMDMTMGYSPTQRLTEEFLTHLQKQGHAEGGSIGPSLDDMRAHLVLHKADGGAIDIKEVGAEEAPNMEVKEFMSPGMDKISLPTGGVDFQPQMPGKQMLPGQPPQQPGMPGQPGQPPGAPQGAMPPGAPPMGAMPPGMPGAPPAPPKGPPSNILAMTPQGQALQAMRPNPMAMPRPPALPMKSMAKGGSTTPSAQEMKQALAKFLEDSQVKERMYHATHGNFNTFRNNQRGIHFVTPSPEFANDFLTNSGQDEHEEGANIMPVHVRAKNPFDYQNKKHVNALATKASLGKLGIDQIKKGDWNRIEDRTTLKAIKDLGHDAVYVNENGVKNLGVFQPNQIKSAIGNRGTYDPTNPDITMKRGGSTHDIQLTERML